MEKIIRKEYLDWLIRGKDKQIIKVVSGIRRCGKSTMFEIFRSHLLKTGVSEEQIISINFEDVDFEQLDDYKKLYEYIKPLLNTNKMNYIFLDEIQHVADYQKAVDSLFIKEYCDVYITGSNAYFMSGELATLLSGRYIELQMLPLSFSEFSLGLKGDRATLSITEKFNLYLEYGSFPYLLKHELFNADGMEYLNGLHNSVILNDVVARKKINDVTSLKNVVKFIFHNIGNITSISKISNTLKSGGRNIDSKTISKYLEGLCDSLLLYETPKYNIKGKDYLTTANKYYVADIGLRNLLIKGTDNDIGHVMENLAFLELKRRGYSVYVGKIDSFEVDFVAIKGTDIEYYQISATTLDPSTLERELKPFSKLRDNYPKYLLTLDTIAPVANYEGVKKMNFIDWLLGE